MFVCVKDYTNFIAEKFGKKGSMLGGMSPKEFRETMKDLNNKMMLDLSKTTGKRLLKDYSPYLSGFQAYLYTETVEIPGELLSLVIYCKKK